MIRQADEHDIGAVMALYAGAPAGTLCPVPTHAATLRAIAAGGLFALCAEGALAGTLVLDRAQPAEYAQVKWQIPAAPERVLTVHALCVAPAARRQGCATALLRFALGRARELDCVAVRLDAWGSNAPACALYEGLGFSRAGALPAVVDGRADEQVFYEHKA